MNVSKKCFLIGLTTAACWISSLTPLCAQHSHGYYGYHSPYSILSSRIYSQASLLHESGHAAVNFAIARDIRAQAYRKEIANSLERVKVYWKKIEIFEKERFKRAISREDNKRLGNSKTWRRLKNHPDLTGHSIKNGKALNFLLTRLSGSVLAYEFSKNSSSPGDPAQQALMLDKETLHSLTLRQRLSGGDQSLFRADDGQPLDIGWWPHSLRGDKFKVSRDIFAAERKVVIKEAKEGTISNKALNDLMEAFLNLSEQFHTYYNKERRHKGGVSTWSKYKRSDLFLKSLWGEIGLLETTGDISTLDAGLSLPLGKEGGSLLVLLRYMSRNGLDFAPAKPNDVQAYHRVFIMMRDLYINVADDDEALQPQRYLNKLKLNGKVD